MGDSASRALVIIPTYNERENIRRLVPEVLRQDARFDILVIDDASPDGTGEEAEAMASEEPRVHVLHRAGKLGLGTAYIEGFRWGLARDYEYFFEMDADFSHDPGHLPAFMKAIEDADVVVGSRYLEGGSPSSTGRSGGCSCRISPTCTHGSRHLQRTR